MTVRYGFGSAFLLGINISNEKNVAILLLGINCLFCCCWSSDHLTRYGKNLKAPPGSYKIVPGNVYLYAYEVKSCVSWQ